jgi:hypothetical protein
MYVAWGAPLVLGGAVLYRLNRLERLIEELRGAEDRYTLALQPPHTRPAHTPFAISRSLNFWILPVEVRGSSANTILRGHL